MQQLNEGLNINPEVLAQTQSNIIAQNAVRLVQMEAAVQQLMNENQQLKAQLAELQPDEDIEQEG